MVAYPFFGLPAWVGFVVSWRFAGSSGSFVVSWRFAGFFLVCVLCPGVFRGSSWVRSLCPGVLRVFLGCSLCRFRFPGFFLGCFVVSWRFAGFFLGCVRCVLVLRGSSWVAFVVSWRFAGFLGCVRCVVAFCGVINGLL